MKHKVVMLQSQRGVNDGDIYPKLYKEGEEYDIGPDLLRAFIDVGAVDLAGPKNPPDARETKIVGPEETKPDMTKRNKK